MAARTSSTLTRPTLLGAALALALLAALALAGAAPATAGAAPAAKAAKFQRGHLPAIGSIELTETWHGLAAISVPVTYTKAVRGHAGGLEFAEVTLRVARRLRHGRAAGVTAVRTHRHRVVASGTVRDRFVLGRAASRALLGAGRRQRGRLVRVDVRHRIRERRGGPALHEKDASLTMASSHRARPQGEAGQLTLRNDTATPIRTFSTPILCMYSEGEEGSNLQAFSTGDGAPILPGGTVEAHIEADGSLLHGAVYQGPGGTKGDDFDWASIGVEYLASEFEVELTPFALLFDVTTNCSLAASTFQIVAAAAGEGEAEPPSSSEAWVLTAQNCSHGCPRSNFISAFDALEFEGVGEEQVNPGIWPKSRPILEGLAGGWRSPPVPREAPGRIVQDRALHWSWKELAELREVEEHWTYEGWEETETWSKAWEVSVHEGSSPAGFSG